VRCGSIVCLCTDKCLILVCPLYDTSAILNMYMAVLRVTRSLKGIHSLATTACGGVSVVATESMSKRAGSALAKKMMVPGITKKLALAALLTQCNTQSAVVEGRAGSA
jgi:hypothetical protein